MSIEHATGGNHGAAGPLAASTDQPLGEPVDFITATVPSRSELRGRYVLLAPIDPGQDSASLYELTHAPNGDPSLWTYLPDGPFASETAYRAYLTGHAASSDPLFYGVHAIGRDGTIGAAQGEISLLSIVPEHGTIEIGYVLFTGPLKRTRIATEAVYLLAREAFDTLGYRRLEWKCNAVNAASRRAAQRYGFRFEGVFAQHRVFKGRNRDTAWFAMTDRDWPVIRAGFEQWLDPQNFDADGCQRHTLASATSAASVADS